MLLAVQSEGPVEGDCWIYQGCTSSGYGVITYNPKDPRFAGIKIGRKRGSSKKSDGSNGGWPAIMPHQLFYFLKYGNPPKETELAHRCHRRACCNPDHVRPVPKSVNIQEMYTYRVDRELRDAVLELLEQDYPTTKVADMMCMPRAVVRRILREADWKNQTEIFDPEVPF